MKSIYEFVPPLHCGIVSQTGGGKTYLAEKIFHNLPYYAIFINWQFEKYFKKYYECKNLKDVIYCLDKLKQTKVVINTNNPSTVNELINYIWALKKQNKKFAEKHVYLFFDEIQNYSTSDRITAVFNQGRRWNIHGVLICRQIQEMKNLRLISECQHMVFFRLNDVGLSTLRNNYRIRIPDYVLNYINAGRYYDEIFKSDYYCCLYDGVTFFIFNKNGEFVRHYSPLEIGKNGVQEPEGKRLAGEITQQKIGDRPEDMEGHKDTEKTESN